MSDIASGAGEGSAETETFAQIGGLLDFYARRTPAAPALLAPGRPPLTYAVQSIGNIAREGQPVLPIDQTWLSLMLKECPTGITGSCNYKSELLDGLMVGEWMAELVTLLGTAVAQPDAPLGRLLDRRAT
ncbi:hypothetical protein AC630_22220 [Bradyrhizobium sp. AS23.2]|nr:hypothetical protein AC630_22220 [Bradyrhizobium sp. AS23.2]